MSNNLENQAPADTFKALLQTGNNAGVQGNITPIQDGKGDDTALAISSNAARVNGAFAVTGNSDISGDLTVAGDFTVSGTTTTINTETLEIEDETLVIASTVDHTQLVQPSGILWGNNTNPPKLTYTEGEGFNFSGGNVGVGVTPSAKLHVPNVDTIAGKNLANASILVGTTGNGIGIDNNEIVKRGGVAAAGSSLNIASQGAEGSIQFRTGVNPDSNDEPYERVTIDSSGNVDINNSLVVAGPTTTKRLIINREDVDGAWDQQPTLYLRTVGSQSPAEKDFGVILSNSDIAIHAETPGVSDNTYTPHLLVSCPGVARSPGRIGINNTNPDSTLHIKSELGSTGNDGVYTLKLEAPDPSIYLDDKTQAGGMGILWQAGGDSDYRGGLRFFRDNDDEDVDLIIDKDGRVGIGTAFPDTTMEVKKGTSSVKLLQNDKSAITFEAGSFADLHISHDGTTNKMHISHGSSVGASKIVTVDANNRRLGIGTVTPKAPLEVSSTTGGVILPRMTGAQMNAISNPTPGEMVFNTTDSKFYGYNGTSWVALH